MTAIHKMNQHMDSLEAMSIAQEHAFLSFLRMSGSVQAAARSENHNQICTSKISNEKIAHLAANHFHNFLINARNMEINHMNADLRGWMKV